MNPKKITITVSGTVCSGKTTVATLLSELLKAGEFGKVNLAEDPDGVVLNDYDLRQRIDNLKDNIEIDIVQEQLHRGSV